MQCSPDLCTELAGDIYNFSKVKNEELVDIGQGKSFEKLITDYDDGGIYCCAAHCASNTKSCCIKLKGSHIASYVG